MFRQVALAIGVLLLGAPGVARQVALEPNCLDLTEEHSKITLSGLLGVRLFAGPPNYEGIAEGDAEEWALILELPERACASGTFIDVSTKFDRGHVSWHEPTIRDALRAVVGREVSVRGEALAAHTGHHHAPLVLFAEEVTVR